MMRSKLVDEKLRQERIDCKSLDAASARRVTTRGVQLNQTRNGRKPS
jgi:hypothetical protein